MSFQNRTENLMHLGNRMLLRHVATSGGLGDKLPPSRKFVAELVEEFSRYLLERDELATPAEFFRRMADGLNRISSLDQDTALLWLKWQDDPRTQQPFPPSMAVKLSPTGQLDFEPV